MPIFSRRCCALVILLAAARGASATEVAGASAAKRGEAGAVTLPEDPPASGETEGGKPAGGEAGEGGEEGAKEKVEKKMERHIDMGISLMLLGSITFMMVLFYLVNYKDEEFVYYSWSVISSTISIFCAVLIFQAFDGVLNYFVIGEEGMEEAEKQGPGQDQVLLGFAHMVFWFIMLQFTLAHISGAINIKICGIPIKGWAAKEKEEEQQIQESRTVSPEELEEIEDKKEAEEMAMEVNMKCFAVLLGHITGFASISAFGNLQQILVAEHGMFPGNACIGIMVPLLAWFYTRMLGLITDHIRERVSKGDDGKVDEAEELWDDETEETEDDVVGLCISFLVIQIVRFLIGGILPNAEGEEEGEPKHKTSQSLMLFGTGLAWVFFLLLATQLCMKEESKSRIVPQMRIVISMCFAWCLYFSVDWAITNNLTFESPMEGEVALALVVSALALSCIRILDAMADADWTTKPVDHFIRNDLIVALGILIGFSWEKNFDIAVTTIAENTHKTLPPPISKLILAIIISAIVVPAWWKFILPTKLHHEKELEEAEKAKERAETGELEEPLMKGKPLANMTLKDLKDEVRAVKKKMGDKHKDNAKLEQKNRELEASMAKMLTEIKELHKIADSLKA